MGKLAVIMLLVVLLTGLVSVSPSVDVSAQESQELIEKRTRTSKTYSLGGDKYALDVSIDSIHYKDNPDDPAELWKDIDPTIQPSDRTNWGWEVVKGNWHLLVRDDTSVAVGKDGHWIGFRYEGFAYLDIETKEYVVLQQAQPVAPVVEGNKIRWENLFHGVNLEYVYTNDRFKENLEITQTARDWLTANPPSSYGLNNQTSYLVGYLEADWKNAYSAEDEDGAVIDWGIASEFEDKSIFFRHPVKDYLVSALPLDWARHDDVEPENWVPIRKRFISKDDKHWLLFGSKITELNQLPAGTITFDPTVVEQVGASADDAIEGADGTTYIITPDLVMGNWASFIYSGWRFASVTIPVGATIDDAKLTWRASASDTGSFENDLYGEDGAAPAQFAAGGAGTNDVSSRDRTTAAVQCDSGDVGNWTSGEDYDSPDIEPIITELQGSYDYSGGAPIVILAIYQSGNGERLSEGWDTDPGLAAILTINYTEGGAVAPTVVTNNATSVEETTATLSGNITATGGENCTDRGFQWDIDTGAPYADNWTEAGNFGVGNFTHGATSLTKGELYYYRAGANNTAGWGWGSEVTFLTKPDEPNTLVATGLYQQVNLTWNKGTGADNTTITVKEDSYPANRADGTVIYDSTGTSYSHTGLGDSEDWYYRAWSWCTEGGEEQYSDLYAQANATTSGAPPPPAIPSEILPEGRPAPIGIGHLAWFIPLVLFTVPAFWKRNALMFMLAAACSLMMGFYWYVIFTTNLGMSLGIVLAAFGLICLVFAIGCLFKRRRTRE